MYPRTIINSTQLQETILFRESRRGQYISLQSKEIYILSVITESLSRESAVRPLT